ncbi:MAG: ATP-binding protein [Bacteroidota bacterium]|nr:ATP-binding protein [Bacteroidota bacterium]
MKDKAKRKWKHNVVQAIPEIIFRIDKQGKLIDYHASSSGTLALASQEFIGKKLDDLGLPEIVIKHNKELIKLAFNTGEIQKYEYELETGDGLKYYEARVVPISDDEVINIVSDITERKVARISLMAAERDKSAILNSMSDLFLFYDPDLRIRWASKAAAESINKPQEDLTGAYCYKIWHNRSEPCDNCPVLLAKETGIPQATEKQTPDGRIWHMKGNPVYNEVGEIIGMTEMGQDITYQRKFQEELEKAKEKVEKISQFKSEFLSNLSHEIRTPLNVIIGFADLLENAIFDKKQKEYIESIKSSSNNIVMLIDDILDISRIEAGKLNLQFKSVNLYEVMKDIKQMFAMKVAQKHLDLVTEIDKDIPRFLILDEIRVKQVLTNLLSNAIKYTDEGHIKINIQQVEKRSVLGSEEIDIRIVVEDSGVGIPDSEIDRLFEPFTQVKTRRVKGIRGHGLGLAITKSIVEMMDGSIKVESEVSKGTRFLIDIPEVVVHTFSLSYSQKPDASIVALKGKTVLLVDDSEINRKLVKENMENAGIKIIEAEDGKMAVSIAEKIKPDMILMDILMPRMDGFEATNIIRNNPELRGTPIIALTALAMKEDVEKIEETGFDDYLLKPFHISDLFEKVSKVFDNIITQDIRSDDVFSTDDKSYQPESVTSAYDQLNEKFLHRWNEIIMNKEFQSINDFAEGITEIGDESGIDFIQTFGICLNSYAKDFDVENIDVCLNTFPKLLEKLKFLKENIS